jgi:hypothetical protein
MRRTYLSSARIEELRGDLSPKEMAIIKSLNQLRLASASQLERLHFPGDSARNRRRVLQAMTERGLLFRLDRVIGGQRAGSSGFQYSLGVAGKRILAEHQGVRIRQATATGSPFQAHTLAVTEVAVRLYEAERAGLVEVLDFQGEPHCWRRYPGPGGASVTCKPDAYVRLGIGQFSDSYFIEVDRGFESPETLAKKANEYRRYWASGIEQSWRGVFPRVLWTTPDERRYQTLVDILGRQPAESWALHLTTTYDNAISIMTEGAA